MPAEQALYNSTGTADIDIPDLEVFQDIVVLDPVREETSKGGLIIADVGDAQKVRWGVVVAHGPGRYHESIPGIDQAAVFIPVTVKLGQVVSFGQFQSGGEPIKMNGKEYLLCRMGDLWCGKKGT